jgi:AmmeMemoRadiSam system protein A
MLARGALQRSLEGEAEPDPRDIGIQLTPLLEQRRGTFVTLRRSGELRGCIGEIQAARPLYRSVMGIAVSAATQDHRFDPVTRDELDLLDIHVSALTAPRPVDSWEEIELGRHGIVMQKEGRSATFLPQVAPEQGWDLETTLTRLCQKAGLEPDAWREGARFLVFEAEVFGENDD